MAVTGAGETGTFSSVQYRAPTGTTGPAARWENPRSDPYSVMNVFSRQHRYAKGGGRNEGSVRFYNSWDYSVTLKVH